MTPAALSAATAVAAAASSSSSRLQRTQSHQKSLVRASSRLRAAVDHTPSRMAQPTSRYDVDTSSPHATGRSATCA